MTNTDWPTSGLVPEKDEPSKTRNAARGPSEAAGLDVETDDAGVTVAAVERGAAGVTSAAVAVPALEAVLDGGMDASADVGSELSVAANLVEFGTPLGLKFPISQVSECGTKVMSSPRIPVTSRPLIAVEPEPCSMWSEPTASVKGPPEFLM